MKTIRLVSEKGFRVVSTDSIVPGLIKLCSANSVGCAGSVAVTGGAVIGTLIYPIIENPLANAIDRSLGTFDEVDKLTEPNNNPYTAPVSEPVMVVDPYGNVIPFGSGEKLVGSQNGDYQQVLGGDKLPTGVRLDRGGHPNQKDPRARAPHAHQPGVTLPDGNPHLPAYGRN